jgi:hypothetical protein
MSNTSGNNTFGTATNTSPVTATTINTVLLGTFTVTAAATPGVSTITLAGIQYQTVTAGLMWPNLVLGGGGSDLYTTDNGEFGGPPPVYVGTSDPSNAYSFTLTTTAVPEPSSLLLCGLAACGLGFAAWRRRKGGVVAQIEPVLVANSGA